MGNTPSTPPPLVSINAPGNDVLVPYGTSLYAVPPLAPGYHPPRAHGNYQGTGCQGASSYQAFAPRGPVYTRIGTRPRRKRHGHTEPDVSIREYEYEEESRSTELGELPEAVRMRGKGSKMQGPRHHGGRRGMLGPYDGDPRPTSAPVGYMGMRGGQGYPGMHPGAEDMGVGMSMDPSMMRPGKYPGVYPTGPGMPPHMSVPPQYASHESMHRYPPGMGNPYAAHPPRPPPPSTSSPPPSPKSSSKRISPAVQAAINAAVQKSAEMAGKSSSTPTRSRTSPAALAKDKNNEWGEGIDTCICTTDCKCRKGKRAAGWYEGVADIDGEEVPVRGKLNTRWVLVDDLGKDCGDHTDCKKNSSSSSSSSDTEKSQSKSKKKKKRDKKKSETISKAGKPEDLQAEIDKIKKPGDLKQEPPYGPSPYPSHGPGFGPSDMEGWDPEMMQQLRMMEMSGDPYGVGRVSGTDATRAMRCRFNPMITRNLRGPRMPPRPGMRRRYEDDDYEDMGGASPGNPYARPSAMSGKGRNKDSMQAKGRTGFGLRGGGSFDSDSEQSTTIRRNTSKRGGGTLGGRLARSGRNRAHFELNDIDISFGPRRQSGMESFGTDEDGEPAMYNLPKRGVGDRDEGASPRNGRSRISPPGRRGGVRNARTVGKQARAETDDDEDY